MLWFWGSVAGVLALAFVSAWLYDRRGRASGMTDQERASVERSRDNQHRIGDMYGGGGGFGGGGGGGI